MGALTDRVFDAMHRALLAILAAGFLSAVPAAAQDGHRTLGFGRLFSNDAIGDGQDRWRTGSYAVSWVRGKGWDGALPGRPAEVLEFRLRADMIAPANLVTPAAGDRRYVGALSIGAHTHWQAGGTELSAGAGLLGTGPQTGVGELHRVLHEAIGMTAPSPGVLANQIPNRIYPTAQAEAGWSLRTGTGAVFRPFVAGQGGAENLVRIGGELMFGDIWQDGLLIRDAATGHRYVGVRGARSGFGMVMGADVAWVGSSAFLPSSGGYRLTDVRPRARLGLRWQGRKASVFYGMTWLGREFEAQPDGQVVGSLQLGFRF